MVSYTNVPSVSRWKSDSSVTLAMRKSDVVLARIDHLMEKYHARPGQRMVTLADLFFSVQYWIKSVPANRNMEKGREPAMRALYAVLVRELCCAFECTANVLPRELELTFGRELTEKGVETDMQCKKANYASRAEVQTYRILFKGGLAYQWDWWDKTLNPPKRRPLESSYSYRPDAFVASEGQLPCVNYGGFVMTMSRVFYMAPHKQGNADKQDGFYHSTYVAGETVMGAGTMLVKDGRVRRIRSNSGHYKPIDTNMISVLQALKMLGVNLKKIKIENFKGKEVVDAPLFMQKNGNWNAFKASHTTNTQERKEGYFLKEHYRNPPDLNQAVELVDHGY